MKVYTFSQARQNLAEVLDSARKDEVVIRRRGGECFVVSRRLRAGSPFDVHGVTTRASTADILAAVRESRSQRARGR